MTRRGMSFRRPEAGAALAVLVVTIVACSALADTTTSMGDRAGEGGTPFSGLAQSPEANLFTGALATEVSIKVPPGRKNMTPRLALQYSSAAGASAYGYGWDLPIGRIDRSTKWGTPRCTGDHGDEFVLVLPGGGATELVQDPPASGIYRPLVEHSYIEARLDSVANQWTVRDRAGLRYTFGDHSSARVSTTIDGPVLAQNPDGSCDLTSSWMLTHIEDANGNNIDVEWLTTDNVPLPSRVLYGGNSNGIDHFYRVQFSYLLRPPADLPVSHRLGVEQRIVYRLAGAAVYSDVPASNTFVRSYEFFYFDDGLTHSMLNAVTATAEPTQTFVYSSLGDGHASAAEAVVVTLPTGAYPFLREWNDSLEVQASIIDMNGDGRLDLVRGGFFPWTVHFGVGDGADSFGFAPTPVLWKGDNGYSEGRIRNVWVNTGPCDDNGWACTVVDTFDITGDGRVDYVVATQAGQLWRVHTGELKPDGNWGFSDEPILWPAPDRLIRKLKDGKTYRDTVDVNGDGLPDFVDVAGGVWSVWLNNGLGFESAPLPLFPAAVDSIARDIGGDSGSTVHMLADFDGDGLTDLIEYVEALADERCDDFPWDNGLSDYVNKHDCLLLYRNTGQGFSTQPDTFALPYDAGGLSVRQNGEVVSDLVDVSGDGLPDWVEVKDGTWRVLYNLGGQLSPVSFAATAPFDAVATAIWPGGSGPIRKTANRRTVVDMVDLNGDGFLDRVTSGDSEWEVQLNLLSQAPKLLSMMENGLGGTNTIVYEPSTRFDHSGGDGQPDMPFVTWVVSATRLNDGLCVPAGGVNVLDPQENPCIDQGHEVIALFDYQDGRLDVEYELDANGIPIAVIDRGFRGFRRVTRGSIDGNETVSIFGQSSLARGRLLELYYYAGDSASGELVRYEVNEWTSRPAGDARDQVFLSRNARTTYDLGGVAHNIITQNHDIDEYGNVLHTSVLGTRMAQVETFAEYAFAFGANGCFPRDKPKRVYTRTGSTIVEDRHFHYDGAAYGVLSTGNLTSITAWLDTSSSWITTEFEYDPFGNIIVTRNPLGAESSSDYDDGHGTFLYPTVQTNPLGHQTVTAIDYRYGRPAVSWGANGAASATTFVYDPAGRPICEARPGDTVGDCSITTTYTFATSAGEHSTIAVERKQTGFSVGRRTTTYFDALGRERFADVRAVVQGSATVIRRDHAEFDAAGRVRERFYPYPANAGSPSNGSTTFDYNLNGSGYSDPLGRLHQTGHSDGTTTRVEYFGERVVSYDEEGFRTDRLVDAKQRTVREERYDSSGVYSTTSSVLDAMGRVVESYQNDAAQPIKSYSYDSLGRRTSVVDRDSGTWTYGYDAAGNLIYRDDPKPNQHVQYCYDAASRPLRTCGLAEDYNASYPCARRCDAAETRYEYDDSSVPFSIGRLTEVSDAAGAFRVLEYDARGRQLSTEREIDAAGEETSARFEYTYNDTDEVVSIRYPDGEVVTTTYDEAGQPVGLQNDDGEVYISSVWYDELGRATGVWHGNGARDDRSYAGPEMRHRLLSVATTSGGSFGLANLYQYSPRGQIISIDDVDTSVLSNDAVYQYDHLGRLTSFDSFHDQFDRTYEYDAWGNMTRKGELNLDFGDPGDPSVHPHQVLTVDGEAISHDANGNRMTNSAGSQLYLYDAEDRLQTVWSPQGTTSFLYDHEGKRRTRVVDTSGTLQVTRYYNDLIHTTPDGDTVKSYYLGGVRVASRNGSDTGWELAQRGGGLIRVASVWQGRPILLVEVDPLLQNAALLGTVLLLCVLLFSRGRSKRVVGVRVRQADAATLAFVFAVTILPWPLVVRPAAAQCGAPPPPASTVSHLHVDHLGSTQLVTNGSGDIVEQIRYMPYGEIRGRWDGAGNPLGDPPTGEVRFEFTGHESELSTGLVYAGARFYDPVLGSFLTPDPAAEFLNPYSYVGWDPVNGDDPTGECEIVCIFIISAVVGFILGAVEAAVDGASFGEALKAGLINAAISGAASLLGPAGQAVGGAGGWARGAVGALRLASAGYGLYNTAEAFRHGEYLAGSRGALQVISAAFGGLSNSDSGVGAKPSLMPSSFAPLEDAHSSAPTGSRMSTLADLFPRAPAAGTAATVRSSTLTIFGIKIEVGTAWAIDSAGNTQVFDILSVGFETEVFEISATQGVQLTDAATVGDLGGQSTSLGGSGGPTGPSFGAEYSVGSTYSGVTVYGGAQYGLAPVGAYALRETWTPHGE